MHRSRLPAALAVALCALAAAAEPAAAQRPDYHRADVIRTGTRYVFGNALNPRLLEDSARFWYTSSARDDRGVTYVVDPRRSSRRPLFDNVRLAAALSRSADTLIDASRLPPFTVADTGRVVELRLRGKVFNCTAATYACQALDTAVWNANRALRDGPTWASRSPDRQWDVFLYDHNLYARPAALSDRDAIARRDSVLQGLARTTQRDTTQRDSTQRDSAAARGTRAGRDSVALPDGSVQLTTDGVDQFSYGGDFGELFATTPPSRWQPRRVAVVWAPDSRRLVVQRMDYRGIGRYPLYSSTSTKPADRSYYYAAAGDSVIPLNTAHVIDITERSNVAIDLPPSVSVNFSMAPQWSRTSDLLYIMDASRGYKRMRLSAVDARSGEARTITQDSFPTWVEQRGFRVVNGGEDILFISERDGWSHIYRFGPDGALRNQVTSGAFAVTSIAHVDSVARQVYFHALGSEPGVPYYARLYRIGFDGSGMRLLTPEAGSHSNFFIPKANFFVNTWAAADSPPTISLRSAATGSVAMELMRGDVELLRSIGWTPPEIFTVKARDGTTDLWGLLYKPSDFDPSKRYPIIDHIYPGPQVGSVGAWSFNARHDPRALAELGFIVIQLDHMGTPGRSKPFHDFYYGNMGDNGLPDHIAAIRQLAAQHRWIDIERVGIYGHSGGGFASTDAILRYPDFFKVAVSGAGNHDQRTYGFFWGEKYQGLLTRGANGGDNYEASANYTLAANLKGKLLLMHGDLDNNVHPANTLRIVDALIKANRDFDMLIVPDAAHGLPAYTIRKRWDYFVRHLLGVEPPANYEMMAAPPFQGF